MAAIRRMRAWIDERGEQYDEDYFTYVFAPGAASNNGISTTLAPGQTVIAQVQIQQDSAFEWDYSTCVASDNATDNGFSAPNISIQIMDGGSNRNLFNESIPIGLVAGSGYFPYVLPFPRRFMPKATVTVIFTNFDTAFTYKNIQFNMIGRKIFMRDGNRPLSRFRQLPELSRAASREQGREVLLVEDYFVYHFAFGAIAFGKNNQQNVLVESDSDFEVRTMTAANWFGLNIGAPDTGMSGITFLIKDGGSERHLSNAPVNAFDYVGQIPAYAAATPGAPNFGGLAFILPLPRIFLAQTSMIITCSNITAAVNFARTDLVLAGRKIFELEGE